MGQYYKPLLFNAEENNCTTDTLLASFNAHDYDDGLKLMEHSWVRSPLVSAVMCKIKEYGKARVVWAGDYADDELVRVCIKIKESLIAFENGEIERPLTIYNFKETIDNIKSYLARTTDDYSSVPSALIDREIEGALAMPIEDLRNSSSVRAKNLYIMCDDNEDVISVRFPKTNPRYILNHTKKQYVDIKHLTAEKGWGSDDWFIHPLPLLTCEGCGRGGGDYHRNEDHPSYKYIGLWARDVISVTQNKTELDGFDEIRPGFTESD